MHADLEALLRLQAQDKVVMELEAQRLSLEPELQSLDEELRAAESGHAAARGRAEDAERQRAELEGKIESYRIMQERRRQRLEWVRGAKEASTLMAELDLARTVLAKEEAEWVRSADRVQDAERGVAEQEAAVAELKEAQAPKREELAARFAELDEQIAAARTAREAVASGIAPALQERYERILQGRAPLALYPLRNGACGHCFTAVPLHRRQKLLNGDGLEPCEACGVLLYDREE